MDAVSGSSSRRRSTKPWAHSGYGTSGWAGMARPPGIVDVGDGRPQRRYGRDPAPDEQGQQVTAEGRDLLADDDLDPQAAIPGKRPAGQGRIDPLVVGDGDDVEPGPRDVLQIDDDVGGAVRGDRVDVQVRPARPAVIPLPPRSGQIGKKTATTARGRPPRPARTRGPRRGRR